MIATILLAFANVAVWFALLPLLMQPEQWRTAYLTYGLVPAQFSAVALLTSMFMHATVLHLAGNVYFLVVFGKIIESNWGTPGFALLYFAGGLLAGLAHWAVYPDSTLPLVGASGAVSALMGATVVAFPSAPVNIFGFAGPLFAATMARVNLQAGTALLVWFVYQTLMFVYARGEAGGVAWTSHLIGFATGAIAAAFRARERTDC